MKTLLLILSHKKSICRESQRKHLLQENKDRFIFYYFIGDLNLSEDYVVDDNNNIVYLRVPDNYESLPIKVFHAMNFINKNYPGYSVFKTDDDVVLDLDKLYNTINDNKDEIYFGLSVESKEYETNYHSGKCESPILNNIPIFIPSVKYCAGGGYYIKHDYVGKIFVDKSIFTSRIIFEDVCTGISASKLGISPKYVDIKSNGCSWENPPPVPLNPLPDRILPPVVEFCKCGELKNKRVSNFCPKCNKLY